MLHPARDPDLAGRPCCHRPEPPAVGPLVGLLHQLFDLVESLSDMVYAIDAKGDFVYASPGAAELLGVASEQRRRDLVLAPRCGRRVHVASRDGRPRGADALLLPRSRRAHR